MNSTTATVFHKRAPRKQTLSLLVCGASGTGKSSFINTLVGRRVLFDSENPSSKPSSQSVRFTTTLAELEEPLSDGSKLALSLIETECFGVQLDHQADINNVAEFIEHRYDEVLAEESRIRRNPRFKDNRIDACLYFVEPTSHGLRELDVLTLRRISGIINVIPVLARADTLTPSELVTNKRLVTEDLRFHDINVFDFRFSEEQGALVPAHAVDKHSDTILADNEFYNAVPFAVISSTEFDDNGVALYRRSLPFGTIEVLNPQHCDVALLKEALIDGYLMELKDRTHDVLYETFRTARLDPQENHRASLLMPRELADHAARLKKAQIDRDTALLREEERRVNAEIEAKRLLLVKRERELKELEIKMSASRVSSYQPSQPSSATSTQFSDDQTPRSSAGMNGSTNEFSRGSSEMGSENPFAAHGAPPRIENLGSNRFSSDSADVYADTSQDGLELGSSSSDTAGYVGGSVQEETPGTAPTPQLHVRQTRSKKQLREHTTKLHAELGSLEAQRKEIQRQVASATSSQPLHSHQGASRPEDSPSAALVELTEAVPELSPAGPIQSSSTSPLNIKKAGAA